MSSSSAYAIKCKSSVDHNVRGPGWWSWRLVEGRKCWFKKVGSMPPKSTLSWKSEYVDPEVTSSRRQEIKHIPTPIESKDQPLLDERHRSEIKIATAPTSPPPEPVIEPPSAEMLKTLQERAAERLKALQERAEPKPVRTVLANPYELRKPDMPPDIEPLVPPDIVPLPGPRPPKFVPLAWFPLLLAGMMLGNAAAPRWRDPKSLSGGSREGVPPRGSGQRSDHGAPRSPSSNLPGPRPPACAV